MILVEQYSKRVNDRTSAMCVDARLAPPQVVQYLPGGTPLDEVHKGFLCATPEIFQALTQSYFGSDDTVAVVCVGRRLVGNMSATIFSCLLGPLRYCCGRLCFVLRREQRREASIASGRLNATDVIA